MEAIFLACGAGEPQLKRNPLGGAEQPSAQTLTPSSASVGGAARRPPRARPGPSWSGSRRRIRMAGSHYPCALARGSILLVPDRFGIALSCSGQHLHVSRSTRCSSRCGSASYARSIVVAMDKAPPNPRLKLSVRWCRLCRNAQWKPSFLPAAPAGRSLSATRYTSAQPPPPRRRV